MNSCEYYQELISRLVDGEISRDEHEALMAHMNSCSRCNAMYAVFHDLSEVLSDEAEPLPEGLHENIMAGVRRSAIIKKNRRMRAFGLRTAITAAACAVLVLFAATGFEPGRRAQSVSVRSELPAERAARSAEQSADAAPAAVEYAVPVPTPAPVVQTAAPTPAPVRTPAPVPVYEPAWTPTPVPVQEPDDPDVYDTANDDAVIPYTTQQPEQALYAFWATRQNTEPEAAESAATPDAEPVMIPNTVPAVTTDKEPAAASGEEPAAVSDTKPAVVSNARSAAPAAPEETANGEAAWTQTAEGEGAPPVIEEDSAPRLFAAKPAAPDPEIGSAPEIESIPEIEEKSAPESAAEAESLSEPAPVPEEENVPALGSSPDSTPAPSENVTVYGSEARSRLLAMIGTREEALPAEAELTRAVHVSFVPDDAYGSEEKMDINIYGDFIFCRYYPVGGDAVTYRADCSLVNLDSFLHDCRTGRAAVTPTPAPTPDPYTTEPPAETPAA